LDDRVTVQVGWALWGKPPGSNSDYSVLAASAEPLSQAEFGSVLAHFAPGTPPTEAGLPSSLPWVIISRVGIEDRPYIGMAIQRSSKEVDSVGRPITMTSYFCLPYAELADPPVSYAGLYRELASVQLPYPEGALVRLTVPGLDPAALAAQVTEQNWEPSASAAAGLLLDGPVSIVGSEGSTVEERLQYLDAVAALLPFGYRSDFTASTWSDTGARHQIRLTFAARGREDAGVVQWHSADGGQAKPGGPGGAYLRLLRDVRKRWTAAGQLTSLIDFFAHASAVEGFGDPRGAIAALRDFDFPFIVLAGGRDGTAQPADIRAVFARNRVTEVDPAGRQALLGALIGLGDPNDLPAIKQWWDQVVGDDTEAVRLALVHTCRRLLWAPAPSLAVKDYLVLAAGHGMLDRLVAELIVLPDTDAELYGGLRAAAQLIADWALSAPRPDLPLTRQAVAGTPPLVAELLSQLAGSDWGPPAVLDWLGPETGDFLRPFAVVLGGAAGPVDRPQLDELARYGVACVGALLQAASHNGGLDLVLPVLSSWLAIRAISLPPGNQTESKYWYDLSWALIVTDPGYQAWIDLALLASENDPRFVLKTVYGPTAEPYCQALATAWAELANSAGHAADNLLDDRLAGYLSRVPWLTDGLKVDTVIRVTQLLTRAGSRPQLAATVVSALLDNPGAACSDAARQWLSQARPDVKDPRSGSVLALLRRPQYRFTEPELIDLCTRSCAEEVDPEELCRALAESGVVRSGGSALRILDRVRLRLYKVQTRHDPFGWLRAFATCIAAGGLGQAVADGLRERAVRAAAEDFAYRLDLLYITTTGGRPDAAPELSSDEIENLGWVPRSLEAILKEAKEAGEAKKRPGWSIRRGDKRDRDESDEARTPLTSP
jgi:hypothetical protein